MILILEYWDIMILILGYWDIDIDIDLDMRRWPMERNSDNPFFVFCFTLPELPLEIKFQSKIKKRKKPILI